MHIQGPAHTLSSLYPIVITKYQKNCGILGFRREVDKNCVLLGCHSACSGENWLFGSEFILLCCVYLADLPHNMQKRTPKMSKTHRFENYKNFAQVTQHLRTPHEKVQT